jgi:uroporphyrinogen decarboxylase
MERQPDFSLLRDAITRGGPRDRVPLFELGVHTSHMNAAREHFAGLTPLSEEQWLEPATRFPALIEFWREAGYDYVRPALMFGFTDRSSTLAVDPTGEGEREWASEHGGDIRDRETFESYPWPEIEDLDHRELEHCDAHRPEGMGLILAAGGGFLEWAMRLMGFEGYCTALFQEPDLVRDVHRRIGDHILSAVDHAFEHASIDAVIIGDDMGFRTSTLIAPESLREHVLPWHTRLADLVHSRGALHLLHCCGQISEIMEDLIETVKIDAKHSYEDAIIPVWEAKRRWGDRIGILGGVDMDLMSRADEATFRVRVREVLEKCARGGGYALGTGNRRQLCQA